MIRPITLACMLAAAGSGLYLYQEKHDAQMLDREIGRANRAAEAALARASEKRAEYQLLNDLTRLRELAGAHLASLQETAPTQFTVMTELDHRLPPIGAAPVAPPPLEPQAPAARLPGAPAQPIVAVPAPVPVAQPAWSGVPVAGSPGPRPAPVQSFAAARPVPIPRGPVLAGPGVGTPGFGTPGFSQAAPVAQPAPRVVPQAPTWMASLRPPRGPAPPYAAPATTAPSPAVSYVPRAPIAAYRPDSYSRASYSPPPPAAAAPSAPVAVSALGMARSMAPAP